MNILVILACMYLAGAILNVIHLAKTYKEVDGSPLPFTGYIYGFVMFFFHPLRVIVGTINCIKDWNWMDGKITTDENGNFVRVREEDNDV